MRPYKQDEFVQMVLDAALLVKDDSRIIYNPTDEVYRKFVAFEKMERLQLIPKGYAHVSRTDPSTECPIAKFVMFLSHYLVRDELVPIREAVTCAMLLRIYTDASWSHYRDLTRGMQELDEVSSACLQADTQWHADYSETVH